MSKRFGRNQKRAMRAEIHNLQEKVDIKTEAWEMQNALAARMVAKNRTLRESLDKIASILGPYFYGLPAVKHTVGQIEHNYRLPKSIPIEEVMRRCTDDVDMSYLVSRAVEELTMLQADVRVDDLRCQVHILLETPGGRVAYGVSDSAWHQLRRDRKGMAYEFSRAVGESMANYVAGQLA